MATNCGSIVAAIGSKLTPFLKRGCATMRDRIGGLVTASGGPVDRKFLEGQIKQARDALRMASTSHTLPQTPPHLRRLTSEEITALQKLSYWEQRLIWVNLRAST